MLRKSPRVGPKMGRRKNKKVFFGPKKKSIHMLEELKYFVKRHYFPKNQLVGIIFLSLKSGKILPMELKI